MNTPHPAAVTLTILLTAAGTLAAGCGSAAVTWEEAAERDARATCRYDDQCNGDADGMTIAACTADVVQDYADARAQVPDEPGCITCMMVRAEELERALSSACQTMPDAARVTAACGANQEACAGAP